MWAGFRKVWCPWRKAFYFWKSLWSCLLFFPWWPNGYSVQQVPTEHHKIFCTETGLEWTSSHQCTSSGWGQPSCFGDEPKTHPLPLPKDFSSSLLCPKVSPSYLPSYLPLPYYFLHLISWSFHLQSSKKLSSLSNIKLRQDMRHNAWGRSRALMLKECEKEKARGLLHPKCRSERRKINSLLLEKKKTPSSFSFIFFLVWSEEGDDISVLLRTKRNKKLVAIPKFSPPTYLTSFCPHSIVRVQKNLKRKGKRGRAKLGVRSKRAEMAARRMRLKRKGRSEKAKERAKSEKAK